MARYKIGIVLALFGILLSSCAGLDGQIKFVMIDTQFPETQSTTITPTFEITQTLEPTAIPTPTITPIVVFEPEPREIAFTAVDGRLLTGLYYPAAENPAPLIVLMHWARGDQEEWSKIAVWLQNRTDVDLTPDYNRSWRSANWFPENNREGPIGVFTFNFRECDDICQNWLPGEWLLDARSAMIAASRLPGVDKDRILTAGSSIGADGAIDGCAWFNQTGLGSCLGSYGLSPGSFLTEAYDKAVYSLIFDDPPRPVYCLYALRDDSAIETCSSLLKITQYDYGYIENHGMELFQPFQTPDPMMLLLEFVDESLQQREVVEQ